MSAEPQPEEFVLDIRVDGRIVHTLRIDPAATAGEALALSEAALVEAERVHAPGCSRTSTAAPLPAGRGLRITVDLIPPAAHVLSWPLMDRATAGNQVTTSTYDASGVLIGVSDRLGRRTTYRYDGSGAADPTEVPPDRPPETPPDEPKIVE